MSLANMNPAMEEAWGVIKYLSGDEQERALAESREKARRDLVAMYDTGREEGLEEGVQLGEDNASRRIAHSMLDLGIPEDNCYCKNSSSIFRGKK